MKNAIVDYIRWVRIIQRARKEGRADELLRAARENAEIQKTMLRPKQYATINGAGEIGWGTAMLCFALSSYSIALLSASLWRSCLSWGLMICACMAMPICLWASNRLIIRPRIGYVVFRRDRKFWVTTALSALIGVAISLGLLFLLKPEIARAIQSQVHRPALSNPVPAGQAHIPWFFWISYGPLNGVLYLMMNAVSIKEHRWKWGLLILQIVSAPLIFSLGPGGFVEGTRPAMLFLALVWLSSGIPTLLWFIRKHHRPAPEGE